ncbi:AAA family ATPase [Humibacter antri]
MRAAESVEVRDVVGRALARAEHPIVLIDGPSGAGKSTFADAVVAAWPVSPPRLVRMDDLYPGWDGLDAASVQVTDELLGPLRTTGTGRWRRWDWAASEPAEWNRVTTDHALIVEGCGCLTRRAASLADLRVWLTAADDVRKRRALARDAGGFDTHWDSWQQQWERFVEREEPVSMADAAIDTTE